MQNERPFWNPYLAGIALGLVLLASFLIMGFGLGGSGAANRLAIGAAHIVAPSATEANGYFGGFVGPGKHILNDWLVWEVLGVFLGGLFASYRSGRRGVETLGTVNWSRAKRLGFALLGGLLMGVAARFARGCTSGQGLTGGAVLAVGAWIFLGAVFTGGYLTAPFVRRQWR